LKFNVKEWCGPLCGFLGVEVADGKPFPRVNDRESWVAYVGMAKREGIARLVRMGLGVVGMVPVAGLGWYWGGNETGAAKLSKGMASLVGFVGIGSN
jgi:Sulfotransferase domain